MKQSQENPYADVIGLTGVIGSGKSTVAGLFADRGALVIDADQLAREVLTSAYADSEQIHQLIKETFGEDLYVSGELDRRALAAIVFAEQAQLERLNQIIHPHVQRLFAQKRAAASPGQVVIYDVPLLFENDMEASLAATIVVYCPEELAARRAAERMGVSKAEIRERLGRQISIEEKRQKADYVLDNSRSLEHLEKQVDELWQRLRREQEEKHGNT